jgi:histidine triad (HIT) family protein
MVLPRRHVADAWACDVDLYQAVYGAVHRAASLLHDRPGAEGVTVVEAVREPGWRSIPHLHSHVLPRWAEDDLQPIWEVRLESSDADFQTMRRRLLAEA